MSMLIDDVIEVYSKNNVEIKGKWYICKPIERRKSLFEKTKDAYLCLIGKSFAVHFKEDEVS